MADFNNSSSRNNGSSDRSRGQGQRSSNNDHGRSRHNDSRDGDRRSFNDRGRDGERRSYGSRGRYEDSRGGNDRRSFGADRGRDGDRRSFGNGRGRDDDRRSYGSDRGRDNDRRSYGNDRGRDGDRRSFGNGRGRDGDRRSFGNDRGRDGDRRSYGNDRGRDGDRRSYGNNRGREGDQRHHSNRGGADRNQRPFHAQRPGYREERINQRVNEPDLPNDLDVRDLDPMVLQDLKVLAKDNAEVVAKHMIMAATWLADDPQLALRHARAAKDRAGRVAVVRETAGIAAYHAGEWKEALSELRAARRMSGGPGLIAVMADAERGLGRPEKAIELARTEGVGLDRETEIELAIVVAGARSDLGQYDSAVVTLQQQNPDPNLKTVSNSRLSYAYADALEKVGRLDEARVWFTNAKKQDQDHLLDADERLAQLS
ncbi:hypothetical protein [Corynebacterium sp. HS2168-gen11]|uniref:hypothetical protein n=1 Tax=Corynebacterium sp. HS2168-gen11 TaxID=2974027 RepID=UPI00216AF989|nr:hypothetical protein [Corynebacterium sp. HS2168-gen11]MCS4535022.1 hypothetical protein [Corynebacterium sp. HS2168-gen11]